MASHSSKLFARALARVPGGVNSPVRAFRGLGREPFFVERAAGSKIWDVDRNEYIDYVGTWGPAILGHAPGVVIDAVRSAAARGVSFGIPNPFEVEMAELICRWVPSIEKVRMVNSGTEATMSCLRLARGGAQELFGVRPDLTALGKVIGGGLPVGAFGGRAEIMDQLSPLGPVYQAGTLSGNPLAMAAGLAQLRELERIDAWSSLEKSGARFEELTRESLRDLKLAWVFHRIGSMFCLFFTTEPVTDLASAKRSDPEKFARFFKTCLDRGVYFAPSQFETGFLSTAHTIDDIEKTASVVREALTQS
jgi:glutamate-1-semialdehyde aminotransferase